MKIINDREAMEDRLVAISSRIGFALWQLQELEGISAQYFVLVAQSHKGMGLEAGYKLEKEAKRKTFGATIKSMADAKLLSPEMGEKFSFILAERNWLVHRSRSDSRRAVHYDKDMMELIERVNDIADCSLAMIKELGVLVEEFVLKHGVTKMYVDKKAQEILSLWHGKLEI